MTTNNNTILRYAIIFITIICLVLAGIALLLATPTAMAFDKSSNDNFPHAQSKVDNGLRLADYIDDYNTVCQTVAETKELCKGSYFASHFELGISFGGDLSAAISGDEPIVNFIPRELFQSNTETFVSGDEYSFYIYTSNTDTADNHYFKSSVAIFDAQEILQGDYQYQLTITPILLLDYMYVTTETSQIRLHQTKVSPYAMANNSQYCTIQLSDGISDAIIPCPSQNPNRYYEFATSGRISVERISFSSTVYNVDSYNQGDEQYKYYNDYGYFIVGADFNYLFSKYDHSMPNPCKSTQFALSMVECGLSMVADLPSLLGASVTLNDLTSNFVTVLRTQGAAYNPTNQSYCFDELSNYTKQDAQRRHYDHLVKNVLMRLKHSAKYHTYFSSNDRATGIVQLSHTDKIEHSRLNTRCWIEITKPEEETAEGGQATLYTCQINKTIDINNPPIKQVQCYLPHDCYILPNDSQPFTLMVERNGLYDIVVPEGIDLYINQGLATGSDNHYTLQLRSGHNYALRLVNNTAAIISGTWSADIAEVGNNATIPCSQQEVGHGFLVKYKPTTAGMINLSLDQGRLWQIYTRNVDGAYNIINSLQPYAATQSLDIYVNDLQAYYIEIAVSDTTPTVCLSISPISKMLTETNNTTCYNLSPTTNYQYACFVPSKTGDYYFQFNGLTENNYYQFMVLNSKGYPCIIQKTGPDVLCATSLLAGQTYYIGIRSSFAVTTTPTITQQQPISPW